MTASNFLLLIFYIFCSPIEIFLFSLVVIRRWPAFVFIAFSNYWKTSLALKGNIRCCVIIIACRVNWFENKRPHMWISIDLKTKGHTCEYQKVVGSLLNFGILRKVFLATCYIRYHFLLVVSSLRDNYKLIPKPEACNLPISKLWRRQSKGFAKSVRIPPIYPRYLFFSIFL